MDCPRLDHAAVGNGRVLALVAPTTAIEWLCLPRFDSPTVFASLLDRERGGSFTITLGTEARAGQSAYLANSNVLRTVLEDGPHAVEVIDFAPRTFGARGRIDAPRELIRIVRPLRGQPGIQVRFDPRPDYARRDAQLVASAEGLIVAGHDRAVFLHSNVAPDHLLAGRVVPVRAPLYFVLRHGVPGDPPSLAEVELAERETTRAWRVWAQTCALPSFAPAAVLRSALCLKLHVYEDTGAIIAAATTSIPEALGTPRTWDYRYCWLRDAAFVVEALRRLSHLAEGERFISFLRDVAEAGPLQPLYGIAGERELPESTLDHLAGFAGTGPVRIGNAAAVQQQNDLHGELILCLQTVLLDPRIIVEDADAYWPLVERLVEEAIVLAPMPDTGIWEFRAIPRPYTFSRAMCWAAVQRGAEVATHLGHHDVAARWRTTADREREVVLARGFNPTLGAFTQALDGQHPDAANLLLPSIGLVDARDPRFLSTLDVYARTLGRSGLMLRYQNADDFGETTSAFTMCSFWWAEALAMAGRIDEAITVFERVVAHANPHGLFSEDIDPATGALLGNFPQAYTHVGLIHAAMTIAEMREARDGRARAWT
ncbi:MAG: glycoside hydrolase family 15 protein [Kofleriaceae bacterium]|nr:glycoside hydrolase family 15 protein [Kofleriaceae bacterium]